MSECKFFIPGPTWVRPEILQEMLRPMIAHRSAEFGDLFKRVVTHLKPLFGTTQDTFVAACSGTGILEAAQRSIEEGGAFIPVTDVPARRA